MLRTGLTRLLSWQSSRSLLSSSSQDLSASSPLAAAAAVVTVIQQSQQELCGTSAAVAWQLQRQQHIHTSICAAAPLTQHIVQLDRLRPAAGSTKVVSVPQPAAGSCVLWGAVFLECVSCQLWCTRRQVMSNCSHTIMSPRCRNQSPYTLQAKRWGRGDGGDRGTYCGKGVKGQKARKGAFCMCHTAVQVHSCAAC
jgi:hypothetical protein